MSLPLDEVTRRDIASLKAGTHSFALVGPDGERHPVRLHLWKMRARVISAQLDLFPSGWDFAHGAFRQFIADYDAYWKNRKRPKGGIAYPTDHGGHLLTFDCENVDREEWLYKAIRIPCDPKNLTPVDPFGSN